MSAAIEARSLRKEFGDFVAVRDVDFHVQKGEIFGYLGANGAGKSTTIRMLCGLQKPTSGQAIVAGYDVATSPRDVKRSIGYMSQKFSLYLELSARSNLEFFAGAYGLRGAERSRRIDEVLELTELSERAHDVAGAMPAGTRQSLALACALVHRPEIVFLDEPTAGVDPLSRRRFWSLIRALAEGGTTIFVTTHYMDEAEYCARVGLMVAGELRVLDTPANLKAEHVPGRMVALETPNAREALERLRAMRGVVDASTFGTSLHVRLAEDFDPTLLLSELPQSSVFGSTVTRLHEIEPTLEDVFLAVVSAEAGE